MAVDRSAVVSYSNEELSRILKHFMPLFSDTLQEEAKEQWVRLKLFVCK